MFEELKDVFELATGCKAFVNELLKIKNTRNKLQQNDNNSYSAQLASSGNSAQLESTGEKAVISAIGFNNIAKAKKGSWLTLAEYERDKNNNWVVSFVKTEYIDGEKIKEDIFYCLYKKKFQEVEIIDTIPTIILKRRHNVAKTKILGEDKEGWVFTKNNISAHGETVAEAYRDWLFKTSPRDMREYENLKLTDVKDQNYWVVCYRQITGACSPGTNYFIKNFKDRLKPEMSLQEVLEVTEGQYNSHIFKEFFKRA